MYALIPLLSLLTACGTPPQSLHPAPPEGKVTVGLPQAPDSMISVLSETAITQDILQTLQFPLLDLSLDCSLKKGPALAESWSWSEDGRLLRMKLREDLRFEDGERVDSEDIAFTFALAADPAVNSPAASNLTRLMADGRPKIIGPFEIEWHFSEAYDRDIQIDHISSLAILPAHRLRGVAAEALREHALHRVPLSTGPFRVALHEPGRRILLQANPAFTGPEAWRPQLAEVEMRMIASSSDRLAALGRGELDVAYGLDVGETDGFLREHPDFRLLVRPAMDLDYVAWNLSHSPFSDLRVRQALAHAVPLPDVQKALFRDAQGTCHARPSVGVVSPLLCAAHADQLAPLPYDPERARALLAEAGFGDTDGDGILDRAGAPLRWRLLVPSGSERREKLAKQLQIAWLKVGAEVEVIALPPSQVYAALSEGQYEAAMASWSNLRSADPGALWQCPEGDDRGFNWTGYCNTEVDALVDAGLREPDPGKAAELWRQVQTQIYRDQPYLFLYWLDDLALANPRVSGIEPTALSPWGSLHHWSLADPEAK